MAMCNQLTSVLFKGLTSIGHSAVPGFLAVSPQVVINRAVDYH